MFILKYNILKDERRRYESLKLFCYEEDNAEGAVEGDLTSPRSAKKMIKEHYLSS